MPGLSIPVIRVRPADIGPGCSGVRARQVLDDTAAHPDSFRATFETAQVIPHTRAAAVYAIRGNRGTDINRRNASALADLALQHGIEPLIVTASDGDTGPQDVVTPEEREVTLEATAPGDLILLLGAQGMDRGRELISSAGGS